MNETITLDETTVKTKLQVSNGYYLKFDQLSRLLRATIGLERTRIGQPYLAQELGLSLRQIESLGSLGQALGLLKSVTLKPTPLGELMAQHDNFFDDTGTLWFLHYVIASDPRFLVWHRFANDFVPHAGTFNVQQLRDFYADIENTHSQHTARKHIPAETKSILNAYSEQNFSRLAYLRCRDEQFSLSFREPIAPLVLAAMIARFRDRHRPNTTALSLEELATSRNSPGWICQLGEDRLRASLEALKHVAGFSLESRADLDQLRLTDDTPDWMWMQRYYESR